MRRQRLTKTKLLDRLSAFETSMFELSIDSIKERHIQRVAEEGYQTSQQEISRFRDLVLNIFNALCRVAVGVSDTPDRFARYVQRDVRLSLVEILEPWIPDGVAATIEAFKLMEQGNPLIDVSPDERASLSWADGIVAEALLHAEAEWFAEVVKYGVGKLTVAFFDRGTGVLARLSTEAHQRIGTAFDTSVERIKAAGRNTTVEQNLTLVAGFVRDIFDNTCREILAISNSQDEFRRTLETDIPLFTRGSAKKILPLLNRSPGFIVEIERGFHLHYEGEEIPEDWQTCPGAFVARALNAAAIQWTAEAERHFGAADEQKLLSPVQAPLPAWAVTLRSLRGELSRGQLANRSGGKLKTETIKKHESGERSPNDESLEYYARAFNITVEELRAKLFGVRP